MNELQRQAYLSSLGIESYMPRWHLPSAPMSIACVLPTVAVSPTASDIGSEFDKVADVPKEVSFSPSLLDSLIKSDKPASPLSSTINAASILQQLEEKKAPVIQPFSLSLWRPVPGFLIVDARNSQLALPTELLLGNILRTHLGMAPFTLNEEVMRWPMIENRFVSHTADDARNELQTWLAVENELRPISQLWLMGENVANYFLPRDSAWSNCCWQVKELDNLLIQALILPSLVSLLQQPQQKAKLWASL
jgi:hypothetical protein